MSALHDAMPEELAEGHALAREDGWTRCFVPGEVTSHPDNCIHASRLRWRSSMKMTYDEYVSLRDERDQLARDRAVGGALSVLADHFSLTVEDIQARLSA